MSPVEMFSFALFGYLCFALGRHFGREEGREQQQQREGQR